MRIAFTHNLKMSDDEAEAEFDTAETIAALSDAIRSLGHDVYPVDVTGSVTRLVATLETLRPDLVFNTAEGTHGRYREAFYPALFEQLQLPFTGSSPYVCGITLDKQATKMLVDRAGVPTPAWGFFDRDTSLDSLAEFTYPIIAKPNFEGSSKGVTRDSVIYKPEDARRVVGALLEKYAAGILVEEFIVGRDVTVPFLESVGVLSSASYRLDVDGIEEGHAIYDYQLKNHDSEKVHVEAPATIDDATAKKLEDYTKVVMATLDVRDLGRADYRVTDDGRIYFIEVNALPSLEPGASIYECAKLKGLATETDVINAVLESACMRQNVTTRTRSGDALTVGLTFNLRRVDPNADDVDAEFDAPSTIQAIEESIEALGHQVVRLEATPELPRILSETDVDLVFNIAEGLRGRSREAQVPALLELLDIPYTGSDAAALAVTLDKGLAKRIVRASGIATPAWAVVRAGQPIPDGLSFPVIVKPNDEGSSKGISGKAVARNRDELEAAVGQLHAKFSSALVEEFLTGREFTVGIISGDETTTLPIMEVQFQAAAETLPVYSYEHKTDADKSVALVCPARVDDDLADALRRIATESFDALGCRDVGRVDIRLDAEGVPNFIECNPLPGLSPGFSDLCVAASAGGVEYGALIAAILAPAVGRLQTQRDGQ